MSDQAIVRIFVLIFLAAAVTVLTAARRLGREKAASWLIVIGLVVLALDEGVVTEYWAVVDPQVDKYGMATVLKAVPRSHVLNITIFGTAFFVLLGWIALTAFRRGEQWASRVLLAGWAVVATTQAVTLLTVYSRGLPLPTPGGDAQGEDIGWEQLTVGLLAWAGGLWLMRLSRQPHEAVRSGQ